jgi:hypothetical protein
MGLGVGDVYNLLAEGVYDVAMTVAIMPWPMRRNWRGWTCR